MLRYVMAALLAAAPAAAASAQEPEGKWALAAMPNGCMVQAVSPKGTMLSIWAFAGEEKLGFLLQNRGSFFSLDERHPNRLEPGKRSFHTIIPAMMLKDGQPMLAFGTMGGEGQPQTQAAMLTRIIDFDYDVQQAIEAPRWLMGRTWGTESSDLWLESRIGDQIAR